MRNLWLQFHKEPDDAYARFCLYRGLGPGRTLISAYRTYLASFKNATNGKRTQPSHIPGHWGEECSRWRWVERAEAWDVHVLKNYGERLATRFIGSLDKLAEKTAQAVAKPAMRPKNWKDVLDSLEIIAKYLRPDIVGQPRDRTPVEPAKQPDQVGSVE